MSPEEIAAWMTTAKTAVDTFRNVVQLLPKGAKKDEIEAKVNDAEKALQTSNATLAQALGYKLCRCTFPPQIMLWNQSEQTNVCERCGSKNPAPIGDKMLDMSRRGPNHYF
jgi:hypothetical protein